MATKNGLGDGGSKIKSLRYRGRPSSERELKGLSIKKYDQSKSILSRLKPSKRGS